MPAGLRSPSSPTTPATRSPTFRLPTPWPAWKGRLNGIVVYLTPIYQWASAEHYGKDDYAGGSREPEHSLKDTSTPSSYTNGEYSGNTTCSPAWRELVGIHTAAATMPMPPAPMIGACLDSHPWESAKIPGRAPLSLRRLPKRTVTENSTRCLLTPKISPAYCLRHFPAQLVRNYVRILGRPGTVVTTEQPRPSNMGRPASFNASEPATNAWERYAI